MFNTNSGLLDYLSKEEGVNEYYANEEEMPGIWHGQLLERLGLEEGSRVGRSEFADLVAGLNPSGGKLTARLNKDRRIGYDMSFHAPKSVSLMGLVYGDERLLKAFDEAVLESMQAIEKQMAVRVRVDGQQGQRGQRGSSEMVWGQFRHATSRPVGGEIDPHLHSHCFAFNASFDEVEGKMKAGEFGDIMGFVDVHEAAFHARLMGKVRDLGYGVRLRDGKWWEINGIPAGLNSKFSKRTRQVEALAKELGIRDELKKDGLGALSRENKDVSVDFAEVRGSWIEQLEDKDRVILASSRGRGKYQMEVGNDEAVRRALSELFERNATVREKEILKKALWYGRGDVDLEGVRKKVAENEKEVLGMNNEQRINNNEKNDKLSIVNGELENNNEKLVGDNRKNDKLLVVNDELKSEKKQGLSSRVAGLFGFGKDGGEVEEVLDDSAGRFGSGLVSGMVAGQKYYTTHEVLAEEQRLLDLVGGGLGKFKPISFDRSDLVASGLSAEQQAVVAGLLSSRDGVTLVRGGAGTGKTTTMKVARDMAEGDGRKMWGFAPTVSASRENLRASGFEEVDTVAQLIGSGTDKSGSKAGKNKVANRINRGDIIWIDESGLLGSSDMEKVMEFARGRNAQVWMTGDTRQHSPVMRGNGMEILELSGLVSGLELSEVYRQRENPEYKQAVELLAKGRVGDGLAVLSEMGSVYALGERSERLEALAREYVDGVSGGLDVMLVSPTHAEGKEASFAIREELKS